MLITVSVLANTLEDAGKEQANRFLREPHSMVCTSYGQHSMTEKTQKE